MMTGRGVEAWLDCLNVPIPSRTNIYQGVPVDCILTNNGVVLNSEDPINTSQTTELFNNMGKIFDKQSRAIGAIIEVDSGSDQNSALSLIGSVEWIALRCTGKWTMIPVENLISACDGTGTKLAVFVDSVENLPGVLFALQLGPHAVILSPKPQLWETFKILNGQNAVKEGKNGTSLKRLDRSDDFIPNRLEKAVITRISSGCIGDRVCIDLIQLLKEGEGLLIGSNVKLLTLVHGETFEGEFVPSRPFRVNAGPVHSYILMGDKGGSTKYLSEVKAGDVVRVVDGTYYEGSEGCEGIQEKGYVGRTVTVGRCKIESRPMLMINYTCKTVNGKNNENGQIFLQQAETVRLISPSNDDGINSKGWKTLPVTQAAVGDEILILRNDFGTHIGKRISARVTEK